MKIILLISLSLLTALTHASYLTCIEQNPEDLCETAECIKERIKLSPTAVGIHLNKLNKTFSIIVFKDQKVLFIDSDSRYFEGRDGSVVTIKQTNGYDYSFNVKQHDTETFPISFDIESDSENIYNDIEFESMICTYGLDHTVFK